MGSMGRRACGLLVLDRRLGSAAIHPPAFPHPLLLAVAVSWSCWSLSSWWWCCCCCVPFMPLRHHFPSFSPPPRGSAGRPFATRSSCPARHAFPPNNPHDESFHYKDKACVWSSPKQGFLRLFAPHRGLGGWWATEAGFPPPILLQRRVEREGRLKFRSKGKNEPKQTETKATQHTMTTEFPRTCYA